MQQIESNLSTRTVTFIREPSPAYLKQQKRKERNLQVGAYCRVSTKDEEQLSSYEQQKKPTPS